MSNNNRKGVAAAFSPASSNGQMSGAPLCNGQRWPSTDPGNDRAGTGPARRAGSSESPWSASGATDPRIFESYVGVLPAPDEYGPLSQMYTTLTPEEQSRSRNAPPQQARFPAVHPRAATNPRNDFQQRQAAATTAEIDLDRYMQEQTPATVQRQLAASYGMRRFQADTSDAQYYHRGCGGTRGQ